MSLARKLLAAGVVTPLSIARTATMAGLTGTGLSIGAAPGAGERRYIALVGGAQQGSGAMLITGMTIAGSAGTEVISDNDSRTPAAIYVREVSSGTTGDFECFVDGTPAGQSFAVCRIITGPDGLGGTEGWSDLGADPSVSPTLYGGGVSIACIVNRNSASAGWASPFTEDYEVEYGTDDWFSMALATNAGLVAPTVAPTGQGTQVETVLLVADFRPS